MATAIRSGRRRDEKFRWVLTREQKEAACRRKRAYDKKGAKVAARRTARDTGRGMTFYRCEVCGRYHVAKRNK